MKFTIDYFLWLSHKLIIDDLICVIGVIPQLVDCLSLIPALPAVNVTYKIEKNENLLKKVQKSGNLAKNEGK